VTNNKAGSNQRRGSLTLLVGASNEPWPVGGSLGGYLVISKDLGVGCSGGAHGGIGLHALALREKMT